MNWCRKQSGEHGVNEKEKSGKHALKKFGASMNAFNEAFDREELDETIVDLANRLWGESDCHKHYAITDDMLPNEDGRLHIYDNDARFEFRDIVNKIDADPDRCQFFVMVNDDRTDLRWLVAMSEGTIYSD